MTHVYIDTGAFIALVRRRDRAHQKVAAAWVDLRKERATFVTSDPVIGETATRLRYDAGPEAVATFRVVIEQAVASGGLHLRESDPEVRGAAFDLMAQHQDLRLSDADAVGAATARLDRADAVLGLDHDFRVLGFRLLPEA